MKQRTSTRGSAQGHVSFSVYFGSARAGCHQREGNRPSTSERSRPSRPSIRPLGWIVNLEPMTEDADRLVLVVEDDVSARRPLVKCLEMHRFSVVTAETADEGIEALRTRKLVAGVVDLRLKQGFGRDVVVATPSDVPLSIFSGVPSECAGLERLRPLDAPYREAVFARSASRDPRGDARPVRESSFLAQTAPAPSRVAPSGSARQASGSP